MCVCVHVRVRVHVCMIPSLFPSLFSPPSPSLPSSSPSSNTCRMVHGLCAYMVGYGPLVYGYLPGSSFAMSAVSSVEYRGFTLIPWSPTCVCVCVYVCVCVCAYVACVGVGHNCYKCYENTHNYTISTQQTSGVRHVSFSSGSAPLSCFLAISLHSGSRGNPDRVCSVSSLVLAALEENIARLDFLQLGNRQRLSVSSCSLWNRPHASRKEAIFHAVSNACCSRPLTLT